MAETKSTVPTEARGATFDRPSILSLLEFEEADLFGETNSESFHHVSAIDALGAMLDSSELAYCGDVLAYLESTTLFLSVAAYKRMPVSDAYRKAWPEHLTDMLREHFSEEHGDEDGDDRLSDKDLEELRVKMQEVVTWYLARAKVWPCQKLRSWTFDNADLRELVEQLRPHWLNRPAAKSV